MSRTNSSIDKIRAELAWVMKLQTRIAVVVATCDAARKLDTSPVPVHVQWKRNSGPFDGNTIACDAANMDGAGGRLQDTWSRGTRPALPPPCTCPRYRRRTNLNYRRLLIHWL